MRTDVSRRLRSSDRGAILIHVAVGLLVLLGFSAFAVDMGVMWVSRNQAQNAADAAALAAATSLAFDNATQGQAQQSAIAVGAQNAIWGKAATIKPADITFPTCPPGAPGPPDMCVKVNVYRNSGANALPTFFGRLIGVRSQGVQATATAQVLITNRSDCVKPWAVPDKWIENSDSTGKADGPWSTSSSFDLFYGSGKNKGTPLPNPDVYIPPFNPDGSANANTTGFKIDGTPNDRGLVLTLKPGHPADAIAPGWFLPVDLPRPSGPTTGGDVYRENIDGCNGMIIKPGDTLVNEPGDMIGPTAQGVNDLINEDPNAYWDPVSMQVKDSAYGAGGSPRLVALPVFNTYVYAMGQQSGRLDIQLSNVLGFFIQGMQGNNVVGVLTHKPVLSGTVNNNEDASFLRTVILVR